MAIVTQSSPLFPGTIAENIAYGRADAKFHEIREGAVESGAAEFIETLPEHYDTLVTEGGQNFSGGQRQRLAIARALVTKAPILILDEPTSSLDLKHEQWLIETLQRLRRLKTIILVTHRLETAVDCDQIFVMQGASSSSPVPMRSCLPDGGSTNVCWATVFDNSEETHYVVLC